MIESSESKEVKQDYLEILDAILKKIRASSQFQGFDKSDNVSIFIGKQLVYKSYIGQEPTKNKLAPDAIELIRKAISEPQNLKGSVRIMIGGENVFHAKDGKVIHDRLKLSQSQNQFAQQPRTVSQQPTTNIRSIEDFQKQIDALQQKLQEQQKLIDAIKSQTETFVNISNTSTELGSSKKINELLTAPTNQSPTLDVYLLISALAELRKTFNEQQKTIEQLIQGLENTVKYGTPAIKNSQLQNWIGALEVKVKQTALTLYNQAKTALTPKVDKLRSQIQSQIKDLKFEVNQQIKGFEKKVDIQVDDLPSQIQTDIQNVRDTLGSNLEVSLNKPSINREPHFPTYSLSKEVDQRIDSTKTSVSVPAEDFQHKVVGQVQTVHTEVTKMAQDTQSKAINTVQEGVQAISSSVMETRVKAIEASVGAMLQRFGNKKADGSVSFESQNYYFHQQGNTISIKSKDGRDVLMDGALTPSASEQDIKMLEQLQPMVNEHLSHSAIISESQSSKLRL